MLFSAKCMFLCDVSKKNKEVNTVNLIEKQGKTPIMQQFCCIDKPSCLPTG